MAKIERLMVLAMATGGIVLVGSFGGDPRLAYAIVVLVLLLFGGPPTMQALVAAVASRALPTSDGAKALTCGKDKKSEEF